MSLSADQQAAADQFMQFLIDDTQGEMVLMGTAGTGKTFLTTHLIELARQKAKLIKLLTGGSSDIKIHLTASTNKAAKVLSDKTNEPASTIHSLLGLRVTNDFTTGKTLLRKTRTTEMLTNTLIIVDEASMVDSALLKIIQEMTYQCKVLYIGDPAQLAPVFEPDSPVFTKVKNKAVLSTPQRQVAGDPIIITGNDLKNTVATGLFPDLSKDNNSIMHLSGTDFKAKMDEAFAEESEDNYYKVLAWTNGKVHAYNEYIRKLKGYPTQFIAGETVVTNKPILAGNYTSYPTDSLVKIKDIQPGIERGIKGCWITYSGNNEIFVPNNQHEVTALLKQLSKDKDWTHYFSMKDFFGDLRPVHASTVHKSQGSTYNTVFIDLSDIGTNKKWNDVARLLYVAVTRASEKVYLYGELPSRYKP